MPDRQTDQMLTRAAAFQPASWDPKARTIDLVWTTGAPVRRESWRDGEYIEILSTEESSLDLGRINSGSAPFLKAHNGYSLDAVLGHVVAGSVRRGEGDAWLATVRLSAEEQDAPVVRKIADGIIRNISVGYDVHKWVTTEEAGVTTKRAVLWEPYEISAVPMGADPAAQTRSRDGQNPPAEPAASRSVPMPDKNAPAASQERAPEATPTQQPDVAAERERAVTQERERANTIRTSCRKLGLPDAEADKLVAEGAPVDQARARIIELAAARDNGTPTHGQVRVEQGALDERTTLRRGMEDALLHRASPGKVELSEPGRRYRGLTLTDMAREFLESEGVSTRGMSRMELAGRALSARGMHTTDDFPSLLANVAQKSLRAGYTESPRTFMPFCRQTTLADFKASHRVALGEAPTLERVNEAGEFKAGTIGEAKETIQLVTYGKLLAVTRQTLINDDLDALSRVPQRFGASAARLEGDKVWAIVTSNPTMNDSVALFHAASHKNLAGSGIAFGKSGIQSLRKLTRKQTGINAAVKLGLTLAYVALPTDLEEVLDELLANIAASSATNSVPDSIKRLQYIVEPRLDESSAIAYYGFCDPSQIDTIEYAYLAGQQGVYVETQMGFEVDGMQIKVRHDFGCAAIDHRGCYKQPGASS